MLIVRGNPDHLDGAALVWAEATAARDGQDEVAPLHLARPIIASVAEKSGAILVVALDDAEVVAFAVAQPQEAGTAEVSYVGVSPSAWGRGLGRGVLARLCAELAEAGFGAAELFVYTDNAAAIALYQRLGWRASGPTSVHPRSGKDEQRYRITLSVG